MQPLWRLSLLSSPWRPSLDALPSSMNATKGVGAEMRLPLRLRSQLRREQLEEPRLLGLPR